MTVRINANSCKNALGTVFLLATVFFVCSTFISMRSVFADPIAPVNTGISQSGRQSPRSSTRASNRTIARTTTSRGTAGTTTSRSTTSRATASRTAATSRATTSRAAVSRAGTSRANVTSRSGGSGRVVSSRGQRTTNQTANRSVRARGTTNQSRVAVTGNVTASGTRYAESTTKYGYLNSSLYSGNYSNIVDSTTGMISAEAYANCMDSYYACMDEICTARSTTKGRCSCAGRATNFLEAEEALEAANEELITLSGQLSLLIATKGKGDDLAAAFSLTDAEKVMNCVSWREAKIQYDNGDSSALDNWYKTHTTYAYGTNMSESTAAQNKKPDYCDKVGNNLNFDVSELDGSSSDILAQLKAWADAKDLAKQFQEDDKNLLSKYNNSWNYYKVKLAGSESSLATDSEGATLDTMAKKWGYKLFEYAHNNVCGRVLDSCFNGIWEGCGTPPSVTDSDGKTHAKCQNGATSSCPFNYNSYISVNTNNSDKNYGDVILNERGASNTTSKITSACFGYTTTTTTAGIRTTSGTVTNDPYYSLRGPVADARRSIMQKYLLDANSACDVYGENLKTTAQNISYQKVAAEQALQQKRLEFKQQTESETESNYSTYASNFVSCMDELLDCYYTYDDQEGWTSARIKTYCAQKSQVPHCYEPMVCSPAHLALKAVIDQADKTDCLFAQDFRENTCRNVVTISEILYGANTGKQTLPTYNSLTYGQTVDSAKLRESCLQEAGIEEVRAWGKDAQATYRCSITEIRAKWPMGYSGYKSDSTKTECEHLTACVDGYQVEYNETTEVYTCKEKSITCTIPNATEAKAIYSGGVLSECQVVTCNENYHRSDDYKSCIADTRNYCEDTGFYTANHVATATQTWNGTNWGDCVIENCASGYAEDTEHNTCTEINKACTSEDDANASGTQTWNSATQSYGDCVANGCKTGYSLNTITNKCVKTQTDCAPTAEHATTGTKLWNSSNCTVTGCANGYSVYVGGNKCMKTTDSCNSGDPNAVTAHHTWDDEHDQYGTCIIDTCDDDYAVRTLTNECVPLEAACNTGITNAKPGKKTWNSLTQSYGNCEFTDCMDGYVHEGDACVVDQTDGD